MFVEIWCTGLRLSDHKLSRLARAVDDDDGDNERPRKRAASAASRLAGSRARLLSSAGAKKGLLGGFDTR